MIKKIEENEFEQEVLNNKKMVIVDFFATWSGPCQMLMPVLESIAAKKENEMDIIEVDVDKAQALAMKYEIEAVPTMIIFKNGIMIDRLGGYYPEEELEEELKKYI